MNAAVLSRVWSKKGTCPRLILQLPCDDVSAMLAKQNKQNNVTIGSQIKSILRHIWDAVGPIFTCQDAE